MDIMVPVNIEKRQEERSIPETMSLGFTIVFLVDCYVVRSAEQKRKVSGKKKNGKRMETGNWKSEPGKYSRMGWHDSRYGSSCASRKLQTCSTTFRTIVLFLILRDAAESACIVPCLLA
jgi:hypothetical protein